jgi:3-oxoacyl-[acyl-carrier-protein] synthase-3
MRARFLQREEQRSAEELEEQPELAFEADFLRWMLSDGAGAVALEPSPRADGLSLRVDWIETVSYANEMEACMYAGAVKEHDGRLRGWRDFPDPQSMLEANALAVKQDVRLLNDHIVHYAIGKGLSRVLEKRPLTAEAVTWFLPHYSSAWFRDKLYAEMRAIGFDLPPDRWFTNLVTRGNTGSASIYLILEELYNGGQLREGDTLLCFVPESGRFSTAFMHLTVTTG